MVEVKIRRGNVNVTMPFVRPLLTLAQAIPPKFFEMIYGALTPEIQVTPDELSAGAGNKLSEVFSRFNLYGGPNTITLHPDRLVFDFVQLTAADYPVVYDVMRRVHDAFPLPFSDIDYDRIEATSAVHFDVGPNSDVREYLNRFSPDAATLSPFAELGEFVVEPAARFHLIGTDQVWRCSFGIEKSLASANGLFVDVRIVMFNQSKSVSFADKLTLANRIGAAVRGVLGLELEQ